MKQNIKDKIRWYIRAHGHSSIGGLNLIKTLFQFISNDDQIKLINEIIDNFNNFGEQDVEQELVDLKIKLKQLKQYILNLSISTLNAKKKDELLSILNDVDNNILRIEKIIAKKNYKEKFKLSDILFKALIKIISRYPNKIYGDVIGKKGENIGDEIEIIFKDIEDEPYYLIEGYAMELLFENLIANAIDSILEKISRIQNYCPKIEINFDKLDKNSNQNNENFKFQIKDNGIGISKDNIEKIKQKQSFTTKTNGHGKGIAIVHDVLNDYNGEIEIKSKNAIEVQELKESYADIILKLNLEKV